MYPSRRENTRAVNATLNAERLGFAYEPGTYVFSGVDVSVSKGTLLGIVGPNGSGKSTLLRVMCGLLKPAAGRVLLDGKPLRSFSGAERARRLAFLPQSVNPAFALTVFEVVCLGRYPHVGALRAVGRRDIEVAERCLRDTQTTHLRSRDFTTLSGGERQRVLLASILAQEPAVLLLDEPTSALDIHHQVEIFALLRRLTTTNYGITVVTHDLNLAARFCDELLLLSEHPEPVASGDPATVLTETELARAYGTPIRVAENPVTGTPLVAVEHTGGGQS